MVVPCCFPFKTNPKNGSATKMIPRYSRIYIHVRRCVYVYIYIYILTCMYVWLKKFGKPPQFGAPCGSDASSSSRRPLDPPMPKASHAKSSKMSSARRETRDFELRKKHPDPQWAAKSKTGYWDFAGLSLPLFAGRCLFGGWYALVFKGKVKNKKH